MLKKNILLIFLFICIQNIFGQTEKDIVGYYNLRGGAHYIKPDNTFIIIGYATLISGKWNLLKDGIVEFVPNYEKNAFSVYSRKNEKFKDTTKFMLSYGLYDEETFIHIGSLKSNLPRMKRIFKKGHHCVSFPYLYPVTKKCDTISFSSLPYMREEKYIPEIYTFINKEKHNDYIVYYHKNNPNNQPFYYQYKNGVLYYDDKASEKVDLNSELKKSEFANISSIDYSTDEIYVSQLYKNLDEDVNSDIFKHNYKFDTQKNAYINFLNYVEGEENTKDYDYNNTNIFFKYTRNSNFVKNEKLFVIDQNPIFKEYCSD
jgi:hypothetical protein